MNLRCWNMIVRLYHLYMFTSNMTEKSDKKYLHRRLQSNCYRAILNGNWCNNTMSLYAFVWQKKLLYHQKVENIRVRSELFDRFDRCLINFTTSTTAIACIFNKNVNKVVWNVYQNRVDSHRCRCLSFHLGGRFASSLAFVFVCVFLPYGTFISAKKRNEFFWTKIRWYTVKWKKNLGQLKSHVRLFW